MKHINWIDWHVMQSPETEHDTEYNVNSQINVFLDYWYVIFNVDQFSIVACIVTLNLIYYLQYYFSATHIVCVCVARD